MSPFFHKVAFANGDKVTILLWEIFADFGAGQLRIGQLLLEIHPKRGSVPSDLDAFFRRIEDRGFRLVSLEPIGPGAAEPKPGHNKQTAVEALFLHKTWTPDGFARHQRPKPGGLEDPRE